MKKNIINNNKIKKQNDNINNQNENVNKQYNFNILVKSKLNNFKDIIQNTIKHLYQNKTYDILTTGDVIKYINEFIVLDKLINEVEELILHNPNMELVIEKLQLINNELSSILKQCGTYKLEDLIKVCIGDNKLIINDLLDKQKWDLLLEYFHPISYLFVIIKDECVLSKKDLLKYNKTKTDNDEIVNTDYANNLNCYDVSNEFKEFNMKLKCIKIEILFDKCKQLIVYGILDDVFVPILSNPYIQLKKKEIQENIQSLNNTQILIFDKYISALSLKDYIINDSYVDFFKSFTGICNMVEQLKQKQTINIVKEFIKDDLYLKRNTIMNLLIVCNNIENQYLAYLLYDLISNETNGTTVDSIEQITIYDSFPFNIKQEFKNAMKKTVKYTSNLSNFDTSKIPLEQQICLMNTTDNVKEKAMVKYKEVKAKSEDGGTKARTYLEGLLKIPFNIYKKEPILNKMTSIRNQFVNVTQYKLFKNLQINTFLTNVDILNLLQKMKDIIYNEEHNEYIIKLFLKGFTTMEKSTILQEIIKINDYIHSNNIEIDKISLGKNKVSLVGNLTKWINNINTNTIHSHCIKDIFYKYCCINISFPSNVQNDDFINSIKIFNKLDNEMKSISLDMSHIRDTLNKCVHGHSNAKKQIELIIGQWINGTKQSIDACVLGFEGNPGIGKTTLAKGLSNCLIDENGTPRPLSIIAIGGDANASTLVGHSYTYVGSTWGQIVQILIDQKCMNPIIVIDEVDKISKTEHGKEIIGVLTHLLDPSQNYNFQDKYFSGINLDLSKILFILSYNDADSIDRIMLDRVHRIKFDSLSIEDKIVICNKHLLPELYDKFGLNNTFHFSDEVLKFIIKEYTLEPGVRKLKEKLFEIIGDINLDILCNHQMYKLPIEITIQDVKHKYFKDKRIVKIQKIHPTSEVGLINALWANELSQGGVLPLQVSFIPSNKFLDLTLTGSLGDVMKESIQVSLTNAWNLTNNTIQQELIQKYNNPSKNQVYGLHIHCPSISTKKDGPSATTAFTVIIYSLFNNIKIKNYFGITGETSFDYKLTEIGGLREKIIHSIPAGITEFIYPKENEIDFKKIMDVYKDNEIIKGIKFHCIETIQEVFDLILEK